MSCTCGLVIKNADGVANARKFFDAYDNSGGQTVAGTAVTVNLDTVRTNTDSAVFSLASDVLTITLAVTSMLLINYRNTLGTRGAGDFQFEFWPELDNSEIAGSRVRGGKGT